VLTLTLVALTILTAVSGLRLAVVAAMATGVVLLMTVPLLTDFFMLEWPPPGLLAASLTASAAAILAVLVLSRMHARRYPADHATEPPV
jgi:cation-transporting ATPase E